MKVGLFASCAIALSLAPLTVPAQGVVLSATEARPLPSRVVGHDYQIFVAKPDGYDTATARYPVLYMLDAYDQFALVTQLYRILRLSGQVPPLLLIGISYPGTFADYIRWRALDFTPTKLSVDSVRRLYGAGMAGFTPASGGMDAFLRSLQTELIPFVEQNYKANPNDRAILGMSYGGLLTASLVARSPQLFQRVLVGSPALWWDDYVFFKTAPPDLASLQSPMRVLLTVGADETSDMLTAYDRFRSYLEALAARTPGFTVTAVKFPGESHMTVQGTMYSRALRALYSK